MSKRIKNIYFWIGIVGVIFSAAGVNFDTLTSWDLLLKSILDILSNPVSVVSVIIACCGVFIDPTTPGIKDNK